MVKTKKILFTGGGSAGHVVPNIAIIEKISPLFKDQIYYMGSHQGIEKELITQLGIPYYAISTGKLRRYLSWKNLIDPLRVGVGILQAIFWLLKLKPTLVFSKGGFVSLPVVVAAGLLRIKVIVHEADLTIGLANRLSFPFADYICLTFAESQKFTPKGASVIISGLPLRNALFQGSTLKGLDLCGFNRNKRLLLVVGGSLGAHKINAVLRLILPELLRRFNVAHICGKGGIDTNLSWPGYRQFEYLNEDFPHLLAAADLVISRAGANMIYELLALCKPAILLPLSQQASRGDQIINARYYLAQGWGEVLFEPQLNGASLLAKINVVEEQLYLLTDRLHRLKLPQATEIIAELIAKVA